MSQAGHRCIGACEIDDYARQIYSKQFPGIKIWTDATKIIPKELPDFECLCAGFPCQAFSIAGKRRGFEDTRGSLFFEIARIAKEKRPRYLLLENVKGLLNHDQGKTFRTIISTLDEMGYDAEWQVLNSKYFVPQNRERVFIIGHLRGTSRSKIFPLGEDNKQTIELQSINTTGLIPVTKDHNKLRETKNQSLAIDANYWKGPDNHGQRTLVHVIGSTQKHSAHKINESTSLTEAMGKGGGHVPMIIAWSQSHRENGKVESRIKENEANTLNTGDGCRTQSSATFVKENSNIRKLTPLECERLQGFPDNWTEDLSDTQRYRCMGNAVTVPVVRYIAECL